MISVHDDSAVTTGGQQATPAKLPAKHVAYRPETRPFHLLRMLISLLHFFLNARFGNILRARPIASASLGVAATLLEL